MKWIWVSTGLGLALLGLSACAGAPTPVVEGYPPATSVGTAPTENQVQDGYPAPAAGGPAVDGYPGPDMTATDSMLQTVEPPTEAPLPAEGQASLSGVLYSVTLRRVVPGTMFYLTQGSGDDGRQLNPVVRGPVGDDIVGFSDDRGRFAINDIPPGVYFLIVNAPMNWAEAWETETADEAWAIELNASDRRVLGMVYLPWP